MYLSKVTLPDVTAIHPEQHFTLMFHCVPTSFLLGVPVSSGCFRHPLKVVSPNPKHLASTKLGHWHSVFFGCFFRSMAEKQARASNGRRCFISLQLFGETSSAIERLPGNWTETSFKKALNFFKFFLDTFTWQETITNNHEYGHSL